MRLAISLMVLVITGAVACGQADDVKLVDDDKATPDLLKQIGELQPPELSYADLATKSDLIVVAKLVSRAEVPWDDDDGDDFGRGLTKTWSNRLQVLSVLKGRAAAQIDFVTLEWNSDVIVLKNSNFAELRSKMVLPILVAVETGGEVTDYGLGMGKRRTYEIEPEYLLYLQRIGGEHYVAVSGQRYSGLSVRRLD